MQQDEHHYRLLSNMAYQLENEHCWVKHCWGVYEQNSIVNSCRCRLLNSWNVDYWKGDYDALKMLQITNWTILRQIDERIVQYLISKHSSLSILTLMYPSPSPLNNALSPGYMTCHPYQCLTTPSCWSKHCTTHCIPLHNYKPKKDNFYFFPNKMWWISLRSY